MPRSSSGSSRPSRVSSPIPAKAPPSVSVSRDVVSPPTLGQTLGHSIVMGVGSSIGHRMVGAILGPPQVAVQHTPTCGDLPMLREHLTACLKTGGATCEMEVHAVERCLKGQQ